jgi:hypothetical protein
MRKWIAALAILAAALVVWFALNKSKTASPPARPRDTAAENVAVSNALAAQNTNTLAIIRSNFVRVRATGTLPSATATIPPLPSGPAAPLQFTNFAPATALENMSHVFRQYNQMFGGNPVGINSEITSQLSGDNPKHINFLDPEDGMRINEKGELIDPWGTPYFFHQLSATDMEIHSAGPDKIMWTSDDLVVR